MFARLVSCCVPPAAAEPTPCWQAPIAPLRPLRRIGRRRSAPAPWHAERDAATGCGAFQCRGRVGTKGPSPRPHVARDGPVKWRRHCRSDYRHERAPWFAYRSGGDGCGVRVLWGGTGGVDVAIFPSHSDASPSKTCVSSYTISSIRKCCSLKNLHSVCRELVEGP